MDVTVLDYWPDIVVVAIQKGFCGALSTVSTFVNEVRFSCSSCFFFAFSLFCQLPSVRRPPDGPRQPFGFTQMRRPAPPCCWTRSVPCGAGRRSRLTVEIATETWRFFCCRYTQCWRCTRTISTRIPISSSALQRRGLPGWRSMARRPGRTCEQQLQQDGWAAALYH